MAVCGMAPPQNHSMMHLESNIDTIRRRFLDFRPDLLRSSMNYWHIVLCRFQMSSKVMTLCHLLSSPGLHQACWVEWVTLDISWCGRGWVEASDQVQAGAHFALKGKVRNQIAIDNMIEMSTSTGIGRKYMWSNSRIGVIYVQKCSLYYHVWKRW